MTSLLHGLAMQHLRGAWELANLVPHDNAGAPPPNVSVPYCVSSAAAGNRQPCTACACRLHSLCLWYYAHLLLTKFYQTIAAAPPCECTMTHLFHPLQDALYLDEQTFQRNPLYDLFFIRASTPKREAFNK